MEIITKSAKETQNFGRKVATDLAINHKQSLVLRAKPLVIGLIGDLGSGKTTFVQGFAEGLGIKSRIISPTFILMRKYDLPINHFYHLDLYRLEGNIDNEVKNLGIEEILENKGNIVVIEWAEKIKSLISPKAIWIKFENLSENQRKITLET